ncbi:hypothetical protein GETHLI_11230 [Geothrix limicola]|uniref:Uncharacterized protein n=1 Tax=Geothrix limicola TaxID=2927978 RepID=A0ABQ5QDW6_9BACT|nr:hypothetical protein GETHLI_11230 [Geothrix limicola]
MHPYRGLYWFSLSTNFIAPLVPVTALIIHWRSGRFASRLWMSRLTVFLIVTLVESWSMLATAMGGIHNTWLANLWTIPESLALLWALAGAGDRPIPPAVSSFLGALLLLPMCWDAVSLGLGARWLLSGTFASLVLLGICVRQLFVLFTQPVTRKAWHEPLYWFLASASLSLAIELTFYPLFNLFLRTLSRDWILVPWTAKSLAFLVLNAGLARTYLCPNPS